MPKTRQRTRRPLPESDALQRLGSRLREARTEAGLSQTQLGAPHFTRAYVSAIELGKVRPAVKSLEFMAGKLGKPVSHFIDDSAEIEARRDRKIALDEVSLLLTRATAGQALEILGHLIETSGSPGELARLRIYRATALNFLARGNEALIDLAAVERTSRSIGDSALTLAVRYQTAIALRLSKQHLQARAILVDLAQRLDEAATLDLTMKAKVLKDLGAIAYDLGELDAASGYYKAALEWSKDIGDVASLVTIYHGLALAHRGRGDFEAAAANLQRALGASEVAKDLGTTAVLHNGLAVLSADRGHVDAALEHVEKAIALARLSGQMTYVAHFLNTKAECLIKQEEWEAARGIASEALQVAADTSNDRAAAAARVVLAEVAGRNHEYEEAIRHLSEAAAIYQDLSARPELGEVLMRLSHISQKRGDADQARTYAERAFEATRQTGGLVRR